MKKLKSENISLVTHFIGVVITAIFIFALIFMTFRQIQKLETDFYKFKTEIVNINQYFLQIKSKQKDLFFAEKSEVIKSADYQDFINLIDQTLNEIKDLSEKEKDLIKYFSLENHLSKLTDILENYKSIAKDLSDTYFSLYDPVSGIKIRKKLLLDDILNNQLYVSTRLNLYFNQLLSAEKELFKHKSLKEFRNAVSLIRKNLEHFTPKNQTEQLILNNFLDDFKRYEDLVVHEFETKAKAGFTKDKGYLGLLNKTLEEADITFSAIQNRINEISSSSTPIYYFYFLLSFFFGIIFIMILLYAYYRGIYRPWQLIYKTIHKFKTGEIPDIRILKTTKEFYELSSIIKQYSEYLLERKQFIDALREKNFDKELIELSDKDIFTKSLNELKKSLQETAKHTEEVLKKEELNRWRTEGFAKLGAIMRKNTQNLNDFVDALLKGLLEYMNGLQGAFFIYDPEKEVLNLVKSYAYGKDRKKRQQIKLYEGLIGTAAAEQRFYFFDKVPENYIFLEDAFGKATPESLAILPLVIENQLLGVVEIAFANPLEEHQKEFLESFANEIAITLSYVKINEKTQQLLEQTKKHVTELAEKERLYQKNQEQLKQIILDFEKRLEEKNKQIKNLEQLLQKATNEKNELKRTLEKRETDFQKIMDKVEKEKQEMKKKIAELTQELEKYKNQK